MAEGVPTRVRRALATFAEVFRNPNLRRLMIAWNGLFVADWAYQIALAIYAYRAGGALGVGTVEIVQTIPAAIAAPFTSLLSDRYARHRVYLGANVARVVSMPLLGGAVLADAGTAVVYVLAGVNAVIETTFWPTQTALLPELGEHLLS